MGGKFSKKKILHLILHQCVALFVKNVDCMTFKKIPQANTQSSRLSFQGVVQKENVKSFKNFTFSSI